MDAKELVKPTVLKIERLPQASYSWQQPLKVLWSHQSSLYEGKQYSADSINSRGNSVLGIRQQTAVSEYRLSHYWRT